MFDNSHIGRTIVINNPLGHSSIVPGKSYTISGITSPTKIILDGKIAWNCSNPEAFTFTDKPAEVLSLQIGDKVIVRDGTSSFIAGTELIIEDFVDDSKTKIIVSGSRPGGWLDVTNVYKGLDLDSLRIITLNELVMSHGAHWGLSYLQLVSGIIDFLGENLSELKKRVLIKQKDDVSVTLDTMTIGVNMLIGSDVPDTSPPVTIAAKAELIAYGYRETDPMVQLHAGKKLSDFAKEHDIELTKLLKILLKKGPYKIPGSVGLSLGLLTIDNSVPELPF